jgi:DNA processing protein
MVEPVSRILSGALLPPRLRDLPHPPRKVHLLGELPRGPGVAVVGTREPCAEARQFGLELARDLARAGIIVLSGGAEGIDTAAHLGALEGGGQTVVMAPAGHLKPFPPQNAGLFRTIVERGGAYLSTHPPDEAALRGGFFARNGCLVALAHVLVVVEAPFRSGARNAAAWARRLARPLLVVPSAPWIPTGRGSILELRLGGKVCTGAKDVLQTLEQALVIPAGRVDPPAIEAVSPAQTVLGFAGAETERAELLRVVQAVQAGARHVDAICAISGLATAAVQRHTLTLTLEGVLVADPVGGVGLSTP